MKHTVEKQGVVCESYETHAMIQSTLGAFFALSLYGYASTFYLGQFIGNIVMTIITTFILYMMFVFARSYKQVYVQRVWLPANNLRVVVKR